MALVKTKPTSAGRRSMVKVVNADLYKGAPHAPLLEPQSKRAGRNSFGHITTRHQGGGHKQHYRVIDFRRGKDGITAKVERLEYDPNRSANIVLLCYADGERRYLSFSDAMSLMTMRGPQEAAALLAADLVCLDEFELDDPTNTRLADLLLGLLAERGARFVTTSNTIVGELGDGRMAVDLFRAQLSRIGDAFQGVHVPGADHRRLKVRDGDDPPCWGAQVGRTDEAGWLCLEAVKLDVLLTGLPVVNLRRFAASVQGVCVLGLAPFDDQLAALRFTNLVDRLYDWCVPLRVQSSCRIAELFPEPPLRAAFHRKHRRCQSRLTELCA